MLESPGVLTTVMAIVVVAGILICSFGLQKGVERITKVMMSLQSPSANPVFLFPLFHPPKLFHKLICHRLSVYHTMDNSCKFLMIDVIYNEYVDQDRKQKTALHGDTLRALQTSIEDPEEMPGAGAQGIKSARTYPNPCSPIQ